MSYKIIYANGDAIDEANDLNNAHALLSKKFPECHIEGFPYRWLVWESEEESANDDGSKAVAEII